MNKISLEYVGVNLTRDDVIGQMFLGLSNRIKMGRLLSWLYIKMHDSVWYYVVDEINGVQYNTKVYLCHIEGNIYCPISYGLGEVMNIRPLGCLREDIESTLRSEK